MSNLPNAQQLSAVNPGALAAISEANRGAAAKEASLAQERMQGRSLAQDQAQFQQMQGMRQEELALKQSQDAEERRKTALQENLAATVRQDSQTQNKIRMDLIKAKGNEKTQLLSEMEAINKRRRDNEAKLISVQALTGQTAKTTEEFKALIDRMRTEVTERQGTQTELGDTVGRTALVNILNKVDGFADNLYPNIDPGMQLIASTSTWNILGAFATGQIEEFRAGQFLEAFENKGFDIAPGESITNALKKPKNLRRLEEGFAQDTVAPALAESLVQSSGGTLEQSDALMIAQNVLASISASDSETREPTAQFGGLESAISQAVEETGVNPQILLGALAGLGEQLKETGLDQFGQVTTDPEGVVIDPETYLLGTVDLGRDVPNENGVRGFYARVMQDLGVKLSNSTVGYRAQRDDMENFDRVVSKIEDTFDAEDPSALASSLLFGPDAVIDPESRAFFEDIDPIALDQMEDLISDRFGVLDQLQRIDPNFALGQDEDIDEALLRAGTGIQSARAGIEGDALDKQNLLDALASRGLLEGASDDQLEVLAGLIGGLPPIDTIESRE